jgi:hypothetical protein
VASEELKPHARRLRDFTYALETDWRQGSGKTGAGNTIFDRVCSKLNYLHVILVR